MLVGRDNDPEKDRLLRTARGALRQQQLLRGSVGAVELAKEYRGGGLAVWCVPGVGAPRELCRCTRPGGTGGLPNGKHDAPSPLRVDGDGVGEHGRPSSQSLGLRGNGFENWVLSGGGVAAGIAIIRIG